ncbi:hypothetical protein C4D60_Mb04t26980 [Musa balbisiana]|uniref:[histone H3]-lysine(27) N-methyltransferase n=1 Tax=Musa balbisiana TaxID=52838 RepID=A0A4S8KEZ4_MUSBA|nr:hypothetical protein C4D60_Mb04t26980 [Musa balbisiana]
MEQACSAKTRGFGDRTTSDVTVCLRNRDGRPEWFHCHSTILRRESKYFADRLPENHPASPSRDTGNCIEVHCTGNEYDNYVKLLKLLYLSEESVLDSWDSVKSAIGVLRASVSLQCTSIIQSCILYLEAVPWEEDEEDEIIKVASSLGLEAQPLLARIKPVSTNDTKNVFLSAVRFAMSITSSVPPFTDELKTSAQEQVEYMLLEDEDAPLVAVDEDVKSEVSTGLARMFTTLETALNMLASDVDQSLEAGEHQLLQSLSDLEWMCNIIPKMEMMKEFVSGWAHVSDHILAVIQDEKYSSSLWSVKAKSIEVTGKALDAIGYGTVVLPAPFRVHFLRTWLPYIRKMKPLLDLKSMEDELFPYKMDGDLCQNVEGAITSLVLALPSNDQAEIFTDWMKKTEQLSYPDLSEAFEVWCYRTKAAKRRLMASLNEAGNPTRRYLFIPMAQGFPLIQTRIIDFFRIQRSSGLEKLECRKRKKRSGGLVVAKKKRKLLPFNPIEDPDRRLEQMASLATALTATGAVFSNELTYRPGMAPRSANRATYENGGMQVLSKEDVETLNLCKRMMERGEWPPLMVVYDPLEGFTVEADRFIRDLTIVTEYVGDVDFLKNREHDDGDSMMTLLSAANAARSLVICPDQRSNIARFINGINNHTREGKKKQNLKCVRFSVDGECRVLLVANRDISRGERLYYDYNGSEQEYPTEHFV